MANSVRQQLAMYQSANRQMESALGNGALAKKAVVSQQMSDQLWTDPVSQEVYKRYPLTLTANSSNVTMSAVNALAGSGKTALWTYEVKQGVEVQFLPGNPDHYIIGGMYYTDGSGAIQDCEASIEVWDQFLREYRGTVWVGTTREINDSAVMRQNGHPLTYNGDKEIRAVQGDKVILYVSVPTGVNQINGTKSNFSIRAYHLILMRQG
jgi:hypothetical protein